jgi:hypothetical protein
MAKYNGWANYETWNVALWLAGDDSLYEVALECQNEDRPYHAFRSQLAEHGMTATPDGVAWNHPALAIAELDEMMAEL